MSNYGLGLLVAESNAATEEMKEEITPGTIKGDDGAILLEGEKNKKTSIKKSRWLFSLFLILLVFSSIFILDWVYVSKFNHQLDREMVVLYEQIEPLYKEYRINRDTIEKTRRKIKKLKKEVKRNKKRWILHLFL